MLDGNKISKIDQAIAEITEVIPLILWRFYEELTSQYLSVLLSSK